MSNEKSILIGASLLWCGAYSASKTYYKKNIVTCYSCVFVCNTNGVVGASPVAIAQNGTISLSNNDVWDCIIDNTNLYNAALGTHSLEARIGEAEDNAELAVRTANTAAINAASAIANFDKFKTVTESEYAELLDNDDVDENAYYFVISDSQEE